MIGQSICLIIKQIGLLFYQIPVNHSGGQSGNGDKSQKSEDQISQKKFGIKGMIHDFDPDTGA